VKTYLILIKEEKKLWFTSDQEASFPDSYTIYLTQIIHSAFLLGYSYFETFLSYLVKKIFLNRPKMLPKDKQLKYADILKTNDYEAIIELMIEREIIDLFYKRMDAVVNYFEETLNLDWPDDLKDEIVIISHIRNCIIHNLSRADHRLSRVSKFKTGDAIELNSSEVHSFGLKARSLVRDLYEQAERKRFKTS